MQLWTTEYGTLWAWESTQGLPPLCRAQIEVEFDEVAPADIDELAVAMRLPTAESVRQRLKGRRRCFILQVDDQIATYGWVTHGPEHVGELERRFYIPDDEAYIWDCVTLPAWRGQRFYSALLSHILHQLHHEGTPRIWIGASRLNQPSVQGMANAGFQHVVDVTYLRLYRLSVLWFHRSPSRQRPLVSAAYRILLDKHERRFGQLSLGYKP
ncbi:MAG: GNAT family N-acetyltransferase [Chloroflexota bacterium]|nr:GNAT family N-acetyltransferase [Chloroflexota bacterium]